MPAGRGYRDGVCDRGMRAFVVERYGSNDAVRAVEMPVPAVGHDDVLVQVSAAGVNPVDIKTRDGKMKVVLPHRTPFIFGNEVAGVVTQVGGRVRRFELGDEVYARLPKDRIGAFAEYVAIRDDAVAHKPKTLTMEEAASIPLVGLTSWQALVERANVTSGQKTLIHAGSGGVGTFAIQLAKHLGATVATTASAPTFNLVRGLGADVVIDYRAEDFEIMVRDYDVVFDTLGGRTLEKSIRVLRPGGTLIEIAGPPDPAFAEEIGANPIVALAMRLLSYRVRRMARRARVRYSFLFMRPSGEQLREIGSLIDSGIIRPVIDRVFPFEATKDALAYVESGRAKGKVVVRVR
jgi:NADPH:quinone reductase-like Zn-dependent oxidoreductase